MGFKLNPYDPCVANKTINGKQCTIVWYVDDNKISHVDYDVVSDIINRIEKRFGKMTVTRGKVHVFLGMKITYLENGTAQILTSEYIKEAIVDFGEKLKGSATSPARRDLFEINEESKELGSGKRETFHSVVAKLLYVAKRGRLDVELPIAFLCTRVTCSTEQDWSKLKRALEYLQGTIDEFRVIGADNMSYMRTWVDASYAVHRDMKSHTGGVVSFGTGAVMSKSSKQKLNTKSSTEAELVGASDYLPFAIWAVKFLEAQGYNLDKKEFNQDNQSTIRFETNGTKSRGPNSRHIDIRYFFIKDRLEAGNFKVTYCPTEQMLADFFTKPLQGGLFRKLKEVVMGHKHVDSLKEGVTLAATKERVGESDIARKREKGKSTANVAETCNKVPEQEGRGETQEPPIVAPVKAPRNTYAEALNSRPVRGTRKSRVKSERATRPLTLLK
jgi:KUP system potassium uptake protein